jgi:hypothetical protein
VCGTKTATCETANPVSAGTFEVVYGGAAAQTLVIPADDPEAEPVCFE